MNSHTKSLRLYLYLYTVAILTTVTLRTVSLTSFFNFETAYYSNSTLISVANAVLVAFLVLCLSYIFAGSRRSLVASFSSPATYVPTGISATSLIFLMQRLLKANSDKTVATVTTVCAALALLSAVHFFLNAFLAEERTRLRAGFAIATVMFLCSYAAYIYFGSALPFNAPNKIVDEMAYLFCALFFLYEARISLGRSIWHGYIAFGLISGILSAYSSIPALITYFAKGKSVSTSPEESLMTLALFIFISLRLVLVLSLRDAGESRAISAMESYAQNRQKIVSDAERIRPEVYAVQMTFDDLVREEGEDEIHLLGEDKDDSEEAVIEDEAITAEEAPLQIGEELTPHSEHVEEQITKEQPYGDEDQISMEIIELAPRQSPEEEAPLDESKEEKPSDEKEERETNDEKDTGN